MTDSEIAGLAPEAWQAFNVARDWLTSERLNILVGYAYTKLNVRNSLCEESHRDQVAILESTIFENVTPRLQSAHARRCAHLDGPERNKFLDGYARQILKTRVRYDLSRQAPLDLHRPEADTEAEDAHFDRMFALSPAAGLMRTEEESPEEAAIHAEEAEEHLHRLHSYVESVRYFVSPIQYNYLRASVLDGATRQEMAQDSQRQLTYVRSTLRRAALCLRKVAENQPGLQLSTASEVIAAGTATTELDAGSGHDYAG